VGCAWAFSNIQGCGHDGRALCYGVAARREDLSSETMDVAVKLHHSTIRRVMAAHSGYETATGAARGLPVAVRGNRPTLPLISNPLPLPRRK
jgi:hypothetical protein